MITGAGGWVGRVAATLTDTDSSLLLARTPRTLVVDGVGRSLLGLDALSALSPSAAGLIIHAAFPTQDQVEQLGEAQYLSDVAALRHSVARALGRLGPVDVIYLSSGAASSVERGLQVAERTRVYGRAKIDDEVAYRETVAATGGRLCIVRAFALSGPYMTRPQTYALGNMIMQALGAGAIEVRATRPVRRSYMAIDDMLRIAMFAVGSLAPGESLTFETAGEVVEVGNLAARVADVLGCGPTAVTRPPLETELPADDYVGDPVLVGELATRAGVIPAGLDEQIAVTARWLREQGAA